MKKRVLIVAPFCSLPGEAYFNRFLYVAQILSETNEVTLVTSSFRHFDKKQRDGGALNLPFRVVLIDEPGYKTNISIARVRSHWRFTRNFAKWISSAASANVRYDYVYSAFPLLQTNIILGKQKENLGYRLIIDVQDVWPEALAGAVPLVGKIPLRCLPFSRKADLAYGFADELVAVSRTYLDRARSANKNVRGRVIYIGSDVAKISSVNARELGREEIHFAYLGTLGHSYDLRTMILAFRELCEKGRNYRLHVLGDGPLKEELLKLAGASVTFYGFVAYEEMVSIAKGVDILVNPIKKTAMQSITNKLSDYICLGKPIVSSQTNPEAVAILNDAGAIHYDAGSVPSLVAALERAVSRKNWKMPHHLMAKFDRETSYRCISDLMRDTEKS